MRRARSLVFRSLILVQSVNARLEEHQSLASKRRHVKGFETAIRKASAMSCTLHEWRFRSCLAFGQACCAFDDHAQDTDVIIGGSVGQVWARVGWTHWTVSTNRTWRHVGKCAPRDENGARLGGGRSGVAMPIPGSRHGTLKAVGDRPNGARLERTRTPYGAALALMTAILRQH